jgi:hypothetical protein
VSSSQRFPGPATPRQTLNIQRGPALGKAVGSFVPQLTRKAFEKFGFSAATLIMDWPTIVGGDTAHYTQPERLKWPRLAGEADAEGTVPQQTRSGATLLLRVDDARALDVQYKSRQIIERINAYFGYNAIAEIRIVQGPIERTARAAPRRPVSPAAVREVTGIAHEPLRDALSRLGASVRGR